MELTAPELEKLYKECLRGFLLQAKKLNKALDSELYTEAKEILNEMTSDIEFAIQDDWEGWLND